MQIWLGKQILKQTENQLQDTIKLKELEIKQRELELKEKLLLRQLNEDSTQEKDIAKVLKEALEGI